MPSAQIVPGAGLRKKPSRGWQDARNNPQCFPREGAKHQRRHRSSATATTSAVSAATDPARHACGRDRELLSAQPRNNTQPLKAGRPTIVRAFRVKAGTSASGGRPTCRPFTSYFIDFTASTYNNNRRPATTGQGRRRIWTAWANSAAPPPGTPPADQLRLPLRPQACPTSNQQDVRPSELGRTRIGLVSPRQPRPVAPRAPSILRSLSAAIRERLRGRPHRRSIYPFDSDQQASLQRGVAPDVSAMSRFLPALQPRPTGDVHSPQ